MEDKKFKLVAPYQPTGDQPQAIDQLETGLEEGLARQVLLGVTGSGKTFTMANIIARAQRPALVIAHNKTLAAQLCQEFREFFPENAVEYFVSYYDYYQPEAYIPSSDTYIEKDSAINDEIDKMRHSATASLLERRDVIVVASVSCIYGLGDPEEYRDLSLSLRLDMRMDRDELLDKLVAIQYERNDINFIRGTFRVRGDIVEIFPVASNDIGVRVEFFGDTIERLSEFEVLTGHVKNRINYTIIFPASHYATSPEKMERAIAMIQDDLVTEVQKLEAENKLLEAQRLKQRTEYDIEMMREIGYCNGIENYSRYFDGRAPGEPSYTLLDFFPDDYLLFIDESHVTLPQIRAMYAGDRSRKEMLVQYGFRLPAAFDNRPLMWDEFRQRMGQTIYVSATPAELELSEAGQVVEQIIRPTGLLDPEISVRPIEGQIEDLYGEITATVAAGYRVLVTTLTKKMAESLTEYFTELDVRVRYLHSDIDTLERQEIIQDFRKGEFDVLVGINLLREGLDMPEVSLVAILDADKEGFLRSTRSMIQTIGRAARNAQGRVIMYADVMTDSMRNAIDETNRRRGIQSAYNEAHHITPQSIYKAIPAQLRVTLEPEEERPAGKSRTAKTGASARRAPAPEAPRPAGKRMSEQQLEAAMNEAAMALDFEKAAEYRDQLLALRAQKK
ncbi:MAG: excinuclease ABC subunit UvrB [Christensenellaceae bacterium]